jgi:hypothetical protein
VVAVRVVGDTVQITQDGLLLRTHRHQVHDGLHRDAAPFGDSRPPLDAEVLGDLLVVWECAQLR